MENIILIHHTKKKHVIKNVCDTEHNGCNVFNIYDHHDSVRKEGECNDIRDSQQHSLVRYSSFNHQEASVEKRIENEMILKEYLDEIFPDRIAEDAIIDSYEKKEFDHQLIEEAKFVTADSNDSDLSSSSSVDVTRSVLNNGTRANFFNVKRVLPSAFEDHELPTKKRCSLSVKNNDHDDLPPADYSERITADLDSTLLSFQKVCSINQKQGQKIKWPAIIKLLKIGSANTDEGNIENCVSWITFKRSLKLRFDRLSNSASIKFMKRKPPQMFASLLKKEKYENGALLIYGQTGSHSMVTETKRYAKVICFVNAGILHCNFLTSDSCCETDILGLEDFDFQHTPILFPIVLKESSFFSKIYTIKLVNVNRFKNGS